MFLSCSDSFLERLPEGQLNEGNTDTNISNSALLARGELQKGYANFRDYAFALGYPAMHNFSTADAVKGSTPGDGGVDIIAFESLSIASNNGVIGGYYTLSYTTISNLNRAIALASGIEKEDEKNTIVAEAVVLRAAVYFRLTQAFGAVPYVTKVLDPDAKAPGRTSVSEINAGLREDLIWAIPYLTTRAESVRKGDIGRVTQNMARAVLAKIAIYEKKWSETMTWTNAIITSGDNNLSTPYDKIFIEDSEFGPESVFEINNEFKPNISLDLSSDYAKIQGVRGTPNLGWGFNSPSQTLMAAYEAGDPRKVATIIANGDVLDGITVVADASSYNKFFNKKVYTSPEEKTRYSRQPGNQGLWVNIRLIRYSDIVLMYAEAANELGQTNEALNKLEMVRERARGGNNAVLPRVTDTDQTVLRSKIYHERRIELAMEFERYFDLVRWGLAKDLIPNFQVGKNELYPIPLGEIDNSDGVLTQNPGY